jgi:hypothetical protein
MEKKKIIQSMRHLYTYFQNGLSGGEDEV